VSAVVLKIGIAESTADLFCGGYVRPKMERVQNHWVSGLVHHPEFEVLESTTFRKLDMFPSSGEGRETYSVGSLRKVQ
jgi:hypothetical protein